MSTSPRRNSCSGSSRCLLDHLLERFLGQFRNLLGNPAHEGGLIALSTPGLRRHVRRVRLQQEPVCRNVPNQLPQRALGIGDVAGKGDAKAQLQCTVQHLGILGKAVQHPTEASILLLLQDAQHISPSFAIVDDDR
jgi:hypothetical protein